MNDGTNEEFLNHLKDIVFRLNDISEKITTLENNFKNVSDRLEVIENGTHVLTNHINFVEKIYSTVKIPMNKVVNMLSMTPTHMPETMADSTKHHRIE